MTLYFSDVWTRRYGKWELKSEYVHQTLYIKMKNKQKNRYGYTDIGAVFVGRGAHDITRGPLQTKNL